VKRRFVDALQRAFGNQAEAIDEGVTSHGRNCTGTAGRQRLQDGRMAELTNVLDMSTL
jgi:hypothetical protein